MQVFDFIKKKIFVFRLLIIFLILLLLILFVSRRIINRDNNQELSNSLDPSRFEFDADEAEALIASQEVNEILAESKIVVPGADLITKEGRVINNTGTEVRTDVDYNSSEAPKQTLAISEEELAKETIKISVGPDGFVPNEFKVKAGQAVSLSLTGLDDLAHVLTFKDEILKAVYININPGETKLVVFPAPKEKGSYNFYCDFPGHRSRGEEGVMLVE